MLSAHHCPAVRTGEKRVLEIESNGTDCALDDIGVNLDAPVVDEARQSLPARERVADRFRELGLLADQREFFAQPWLQGVDDRAGFVLSRRAPLVRVASENGHRPNVKRDLRIGLRKIDSGRCVRVGSVVNWNCAFGGSIFAASDNLDETTFFGR